MIPEIGLKFRENLNSYQFQIFTVLLSLTLLI